MRVETRLPNAEKDDDKDGRERMRGRMQGRGGGDSMSKTYIDGLAEGYEAVMKEMQNEYLMNLQIPMRCLKNTWKK